VRLAELDKQKEILLSAPLKVMCYSLYTFSVLIKLSYYVL